VLTDYCRVIVLSTRYSVLVTVGIRISLTANKPLYKPRSTRSSLSSNTRLRVSWLNSDLPIAECRRITRKKSCLRFRKKSLAYSFDFDSGFRFVAVRARIRLAAGEIPIDLSINFRPAGGRFAAARHRSHRAA